MKNIGKSMGVLLSIWLLCVFFISGSLVNAEELPYSTPQSVMQGIKKQGPEAFSKYINKQWRVMLNILRHISKGEKQWLEVARALRQGNHPAVIHMTQNALGEALNHNAENVLRFAGKEYYLVDICGVPDTDDSRFDNLNSARAELKRRQAKVAKLRGKLPKKVKKCLEYLKQAEEHVVLILERKS